jgi:hypothetical protein
MPNELTAARPVAASAVPAHGKGLRAKSSVDSGALKWTVGNPVFDAGAALISPGTQPPRKMAQVRLPTRMAQPRVPPLAP